jgi:hypothetical protein
MQKQELNLKEPIIFYKVSEHLTTFGGDENKTEPLDSGKEFKGSSLLKCAREATAYYYKRWAEIEKSDHILPFASPQNFEYGKNSAYLLTLSLVCYYSEDDQIEHFLLGSDNSDTREAEEYEKLISMDIALHSL